MIVPLASVLMGALGTFATVSRRDRLPREGVRVYPRDACDMSIVLVGVDGTAVARTIDDLTGNRGFSHAYFDPCQRDDNGDPRVIVYTLQDGVHWTDPRTYKTDRRQVRIRLDARTGGEIYGCIRQRIGRPFNLPALVAGMDSAATCVGLIVGCLPWRMQEELRDYQVGPCISPNTLAAYFGVT